MARLDASKSTTFLLGAGASHPYGFPLGTDLRQMLSNHLPSPSDRFPESLIRDFQEVLHGSEDRTVDSLLEKKKRFRELGAWVIAQAIAPAEDHGRLFPPKDWYRALFEWLRLSAPRDERPRVSIVTLNYDRSLEHFLFKNIRINLPDDDEERAHAALKEISILHPHGSLGEYPDVPYKIDSPSLEKAAASIRIISDRLEEKPEFGKAISELQKADQVVVIGFGWDPRTTAALFPQTPSEQFVHVCGFNLAGDRRDMITKMWPSRFEIGADQTGAEEFFRSIT